MKFYSLLLSAVILMSGPVTAQVFIYTGNPNSSSTPAPAKDSGHAPLVKIVQPGQAAPATTHPAPATGIGTAPASTTAPATGVGTATTTTIVQPSHQQPAYNGKLSEANNNLPPNAEVGKCYARCFVPDVFDFKEEMVVDKPSYYDTRTIPASYKTVYDTVITKPAYIKTIETPAVYENVEEDIMVSPATQKWVTGSRATGCLSEDCQVLTLEQVPAVYKKVSRTVVKTPAFKQDIPVPAEYQIVSKQVMDRPAHDEKILVPASYKKVLNKVLVRKGGYSEWKEILCEDKVTPDKVLSIQNALKGKGYDPGPIDNLFGPMSKGAMLRYQQDKNLPQGNLNLETLRSLGVQ